jgi:hypothetical protein
MYAVDNAAKCGIINSIREARDAAFIARLTYCTAMGCW